MCVQIVYYLIRIVSKANTSVIFLSPCCQALGLKEITEDLDETLALDPEILAALKADGIDVDQLDFSDI